MKPLGYRQVEVRPMSVKDAEHQLNLEISENETRKDFSKAERIDYAKRLRVIEELKADKRIKKGVSNPMENFPQGTTRDIVAETLGVGSGRQLEKEEFIVANKDSLTPEDFAEWDEGRLSTNKAFLRIKEQLAEKDRAIADYQSKIKNKYIIRKAPRYIKLCATQDPSFLCDILPLLVVFIVAFAP